MSARRKSIQLSPDEDQLLRLLHRQSGIPDGQFPQRPRFWRQFTDVWNEATDRQDTPEDLLHYIMTRRKRPKGRPGRWDPFGLDFKPLQSPQTDLLTPEQWEVVDALYKEMATGADNFLIDRELRAELLSRFLVRTGTHLPELLFVAALISRRKNGDLPLSGSTQPDDDLGFRDIDKIA